nr:MAG TPA: hypothetical protein [Caudoviricetes sp.]
MYIQICIYIKERRDEKQNNKQDHPDDSGGKAKIRVLCRKNGKDRDGDTYCRSE